MNIIVLSLIASKGKDTEKDYIYAVGEYLFLFCMLLVVKCCNSTHVVVIFFLLALNVRVIVIAFGKNVSRRNFFFNNIYKLPTFMKISSKNILNAFFTILCPIQTVNNA